MPAFAAIRRREQVPSGRTRTPAARTPTAGGVPAAVLALHRAAGNHAVGAAAQQILDGAYVRPPDGEHERQARAAMAHPPAAARPIAPSSGGGEPLAPPERAALESHFGVDLGPVRLHTGPDAHAAADAIAARAFTRGSDVYFGVGRYQPGTPAGRALIRHEVAHVTQRAPAGVVQRQAEDEEEPWYEAAGEWALGAIGGEWMDEQTFGQIGVDFVLSVIPVVDQVADARDLTAHVYRLGFKGEYTQWTRWLALVFTLIGLIPEVGSVIKSASKAVIKGVGELLSHAGDLIRLARRFLPDIGDLRRIEELIASNWTRAVAIGRQAWETLLARGSELAARIPALWRSARERVTAVFGRLRELSGRYLGAAFDRVRETISNVFAQVRQRLGLGGAAPPTHVPAPNAGAADEIEQSFAASFSGQTPPTPVQSTPNLIRGNVGERLAAESLAHRGHTILSYKPDIAGTNQPGIDMVTFFNGTVHLVDNKALTRSGNVSSVSALTTNFTTNLATVRADLVAAVSDATRPAAERALFQQALTALNNGSFVRVVTNANVTRDTQILSGVTQALQQQGIQFLNVF